MQHFTIGLKPQAIMLLDVWARGTIKTKNEYEVKDLIEKMCHNEYCSQSEWGVKPRGVLELNANIVVLPQLKVISK